MTACQSRALSRASARQQDVVPLARVQDADREDQGRLGLGQSADGPVGAGGGAMVMRAGSTP